MSFNVIDYLYTTVKIFPDVCFYRNDPVYFSYNDFFQKVKSLAEVYSHITNSTVMIAPREKNAELYVLLAAMWSNGNTVVPLSDEWDEATIEYVTQTSFATYMFLSNGTPVEINKNLDIAHLGYKNYAYILYTSGSTGKPKGVAITHESLKHYIDSMAEYLGLSYGIERLTNTFSPTFDLFFHDLLLAWKSASSVTPINARYIGKVFKLISKNSITYWFSVPTLAQLVLSLHKDSQDACIKASLFCGEPLQSSTAKGWGKIFGEHDMYNLYGPTEATIACMISKVTEVDSINLGQPIGKMKHKILPYSSESFSLLVTGPQLFSGYITPDIESEYPLFYDIGGEKYYDTGDLVQLIDNKIYYLSRKNRETKIMGRRVDIKSIEDELRLINNDQMIFVVPYYDKVTQSNTGVCLFYSGLSDIESLNINISSTFCKIKKRTKMDSIPTLSSGKTDYKRLNQWALENL